MKSMTTSQMIDFADNLTNRTGSNIPVNELPPHKLFIHLDDAGKAALFVNNLEVMTWATDGASAQHAYRDCTTLARVKRSYRIRDRWTYLWELEGKLCKLCARQIQSDPDLANALAWSHLCQLSRLGSQAQSIATQKLSSYFTPANRAMNAQINLRNMDDLLSRIESSSANRAVVARVRDKVRETHDVLDSLATDDSLALKRLGMAHASVLLCAAAPNGRISGTPDCPAFTSVGNSRSLDTGREVVKNLRWVLTKEQGGMSDVRAAAKYLLGATEAAGPQGWPQMPGTLATPAPRDGQSVAEWMTDNWIAEFKATAENVVEFLGNLVDTAMSYPSPPLRVTLKVSYGESEQAPKNVRDLLLPFDMSTSADGKQTTAVVPAAVAGACLLHGKRLGSGAVLKVEPISPALAELTRTAMAMFTPMTDSPLAQLTACFAVAADSLGLDKAAILAGVPNQYRDYPGVPAASQDMPDRLDSEQDSLF